MIVCERITQKWDGVRFILVDDTIIRKFDT